MLGVEQQVANGGRRKGPVALARARAALRGRLEDRRPEIEEAILTRVYGISDPADADPLYVEGLRRSVTVALDYALEAIERDEKGLPPAPAPLLEQARVAARNGVALDIVLRRYFAGYVLLSDFLAQEAEAERVPSMPGGLVRDRAAIFDRLIAAVSAEHAREAEALRRSSVQRRAELIARLLHGELLDTSDLSYDFEAHHTGLVASGHGASDALRTWASKLNRHLLLLVRRDESVWGWLAGRRPLDPSALEESIRTDAQSLAAVAIGEPARGIAGWRLTHRQAVAALPIALRRDVPLVRYADVALLAAVNNDDLLAQSLRQIYLAPLESDRDRGATARETLRVYFSVDRNISSTAASLGVNRSTVASRLRAIEQKIGRPLRTCSAEIESALDLESLCDSTAPEPLRKVPNI